MTLNLDEIRQLVSAASKGPTRLTIIEPPIDAQVEHIRDALSHGSGPVWGVGLPEHALTVLGDDPDRPDHMVTTCLTGNGPTSEANANLYAASHELIPALCDEVERLREQINGGDVECPACEGSGTDGYTGTDADQCQLCDTAGRIDSKRVREMWTAEIARYTRAEVEVERLRACEKEASTELHRLAKDLGLPDDGPLENRVAAVEMVNRLRAENAKLWETISHFVKKYDECDPYIASAFFLAYTNRGGQYTGPTFKDELGALRALANGGAGGDA